ncbi:MAG: hypothetical protein NTV51_12195 [Verrucomicrobia bacterium]|nr:hypothetical protein [Verrucomicrobiota bacterium]
MSSLLVRSNPIIRTTGVDLSAALGKLVTFANGVVSVSASATVPATGIVLEANTAARDSSIGILGGGLPPVRAKISAASAAIKFGDKLQQAADGTLTLDLGAGNARVTVAICTEPNGAVAGDLAEVTPLTPVIGA